MRSRCSLSSSSDKGPHTLVSGGPAYRSQCVTISQASQLLHKCSTSENSSPPGDLSEPPLNCVVSAVKGSLQRGQSVVMVSSWATCEIYVREQESPITHAAVLEGNLLMIHSTADDNVIIKVRNRLSTIGELVSGEEVEGMKCQART